jgi:hypothetical protein
MSDTEQDVASTDEVAETEQRLGAAGGSRRHTG